MMTAEQVRNWLVDNEAEEWWLWSYGYAPHIKYRIIPASRRMDGDYFMNFKENAAKEEIAKTIAYVQQRALEGSEPHTAALVAHAEHRLCND